MTSAKELAANLGKRARLTVSGSALIFDVEIIDARARFGTLDYKVRPIAGQGETWHAAHSVEIIEQAATLRP